MMSPDIIDDAESCADDAHKMRFGKEDTRQLLSDKISALELWRTYTISKTMIAERVGRRQKRMKKLSETLNDNRQMSKNSGYMFESQKFSHFPGFWSNSLTFFWVPGCDQIP